MLQLSAPGDSTTASRTITGTIFISELMTWSHRFSKGMQIASQTTL